jgi:hypothetical protein
MVRKRKDTESNISREAASEFEDLREPTTIVDQFGRVVAWGLPGVLHPKRLVRLQTWVLSADYSSVLIGRLQ